MLKKLILIMLLATSTLYVQAQLSAVSYKSEEFIKFKATKTLAVKTGNADYDKALEEGMKTFWKVTPYEFITTADLEKRITDVNVSFIAPIIISTGNANQNYHYLALFNGGKKKMKSYTYDDMLAYCPMNFWVNEKTPDQCAYRLINMLGSMTQSMDIVQQKDIKGNSKVIVDGLRDYYNTKAGQIKNRTLLICKETVGSKLKESDISSAYPFKYEFCSLEKLKQVINDKSKDYYYYQPGITLNKSMFVIDPSTSETVYFDYAMMGLYIKDSDLENLTKTIKGGK